MEESDSVQYCTEHRGNTDGGYVHDFGADIRADVILSAKHLGTGAMEQRECMQVRN
jgi:hypothetical protein